MTLEDRNSPAWVHGPTTMAKSMTKLKEPRSRHKINLSSGLLSVDELDYLPIDSPEAALFISSCYAVLYETQRIFPPIKALPTGRTCPVTRRSPQPFCSVFCTTARTVVTIKRHSYRLRKHKKVKNGVPKKGSRALRTHVAGFGGVYGSSDPATGRAIDKRHNSEVMHFHFPENGTLFIPVDSPWSSVISPVKTMTTRRAQTSQIQT